jgi:hypothetical protein
MSLAQAAANIKVPGREDVQAWLALQRETTERVHPSWFPGVAADLIVHARRSPVGRRWLANRLAHVSPLLFGIPHAAQMMSEGNLRGAESLRICLHDALDCALDLGSVAFSATLRAMVTRSEIMRLRMALGAERYQRLLSVPVPTFSPRLSAPFNADSRADDLREGLLRHGARELAAYAASLHPFLDASVRLTFEVNWWDVEAAVLLDPGTVEACLRMRSEHKQEGALASADTQHG